MEIKIVDMAGRVLRKVMLLADRSLDLQMQNMPSGEYFIQFITPNGTVSQKIIVLR